MAAKSNSASTADYARRKAVSNLCSSGQVLSLCEVHEKGRKQWQALKHIFSPGWLSSHECRCILSRLALFDICSRCSRDVVASAEPWSHGCRASDTGDLSKSCRVHSPPHMLQQIRMDAIESRAFSQAHPYRRTCDDAGIAHAASVEKNLTFPGSLVLVLPVCFLKRKS